MTAVACLRIVVGEKLMFADQETMAELVAKVASSYLESRWLWPRRYGLVAPFAFVLADPRVTLLDPRELQALAAELHVKLFGKESEGDVSLMTLEGDQSEVMKFAGATRQELHALLRGEVQGVGSRICRITRDGVESLAPIGGPVVGVPPMEDLGALEPYSARSLFRGVYDLQQQRFVGNALIWKSEDQEVSGCEYANPDGAAAEHDLTGVGAAASTLKTLKVGQFFLSISFSTLVKPSSRAKLIEALNLIPAGHRSRLCASVYDTPRSPTYQALTLVRSGLDRFVSNIDLRVVDPAFQIDSLPPEMARSVTLALPPGTEKTRLAAIARFVGEAGAYKRKKVLQGVSDVRTRRELEACNRLGAPFVTGPAVCGLLDGPVGDLACPLTSLPLHNFRTAA